MVHAWFAGQLISKLEGKNDMFTLLDKLDLQVGMVQRPQCK